MVTIPASRRLAIRSASSRSPDWMEAPSPSGNSGGAHRERIEDARRFIVGGPTHAFSMSTPTTRESAKQQGAEADPGTGIREWIDAHQSPGRAIPVVTFDTRVLSPSLARICGEEGADAPRCIGLWNGRFPSYY